MSFYASLGMKPLRIRREVDGFVADRLLEALWREALWLVHDDVATVEEIDDAIRFGAGLRWAQMGTFLTYRIAGGADGMRHFLEQFGPALAWPWTKLTDVPELTDELIDTIAAQSDAQADGLSIRELERIRDDNLVALLHGLRARRYAAGSVLHEHEVRLFEAAPDTPDDVDPTQPLRLHATVVDPSWIDYNGHMTEFRYLQVFADATDAFLRHVGVDAEYLRHGASAFTVESHLRHLHEVAAFEPIDVATQVLGADEKRLRLFHTLTHARSGETLATGEHLLLHVDTNARAGHSVARAGRGSRRGGGAGPCGAAGARGSRSRDRPEPAGLAHEQRDPDDHQYRPCHPRNADALVEKRHRQHRRDHDARLAHGGD